MRIAWERFKALFRSARLDRELDAELEFHIQEQAGEYTRAGMTGAEALNAARRDFGGVDKVKETYRDRRGFPLAASIFQDFRFGLRMLGRDRAFTAVALATLALTTGAGTAIYSVANTVLFRPLPYPEPDRLMAILSTSLERGDAFYSAPGVFLDWRDRAKSFRGIAGAIHTSAILGGVPEPRVVSVVKATADFLPALGAGASRGRLFLDTGEDRGAALINEVFWRNELGGRADIVGSRAILGENIYTIAGVVPDVRFSVYGATDFWIPFDGAREARAGGSVMTVGRLREGVTREAAQAEMESIMARIRREHSQDSRTGVLVQPLRDWVVGETRRPLVLLCAAATLLLLIGCANIANLLLARASAREREMSIRASLGAGRARLVQQMAVESLTLAFLGGCVGTGLAAMLVRAVPAIESFRIPRAEEVAVDPGMLLIATALSLACGVAFGLAPGWHAGQPSASRLGTRLRGALVVAQLALALVLMNASGLLLNSLIRLLHLDLGFDRSGLVTIQTRLPYKRYNSAAAREFHDRLAEEVSRMPGVKSVSLSDYTPLQAVFFPIQLRSRTGQTEANARHVAPGYFETTGIPMLAGRGFEDADAAAKPIPVVLNAAAAKALFGGENPLGKALEAPLYRSRRDLEVAGVAGDARQLGLRMDPGTQVYFPLSHGHIGYILARVVPGSGSLTAPVRAASAAIDSQVPAPDVSSLDANYSRQVALPRFHAMLFGSFAGLGLVLSVVGIYGVMAYAAAKRTREIGIRMALGADRAGILALLLRSGAKLTCVGALLGIGCALWVARLMGALLYGVQPGDPATLAAMATLLIGSALAACLAAARRASGLDPNLALRSE